MHEEHHVSPISCSNAHAKSKKKTTATNAEDKKIKKRLRDPELVEKMDKPLEEALVYLNHLLKIGERCYKLKNCSTGVFPFGSYNVHRCAVQIFFESVLFTSNKTFCFLYGLFMIKLPQFLLYFAMEFFSYAQSSGAPPPPPPPAPGNHPAKHTPRPDHPTTK
jgi:hypothetical protein